MQMSFIKMAMAAGALMVAVAAPVSAQSDTNVGVNLSFLRDSEQTGTGFSIDVAKGVASNVAVVGDFGLNRFDGWTLTSYLGGVRFTPAVQAAVSPFVQALVGLEHCCESNAFAFQFGGGIDVPVSERLSVRGQYDFRRTRYDGEGYNGHRFGVGVVLPIGGN